MTLPALTGLTEAELGRHLRAASRMINGRMTSVAQAVKTPPPEAPTWIRRGIWLGDERANREEVAI
jgi:hypothetical protein